MIRRILKFLLEAVRAAISYHVRARVVVLCVPRRHWFAAVYRLARVQDWLVLRMRGHPNRHAPKSLTVWMAELTRFGAFDIPVRVTGVDVLVGPETKLLFLPHTVYFEVSVRTAVAHMQTVPYVVAAGCRIEADGRCAVLGLGERMVGIAADRNTLLRMKTVFGAGHSVICLADTYRGKELFAQPMKLAGSMGARIVFVECDLRSDSVFDVRFFEAPCPLVRTAKDLDTNLRRLRQQQERDVALYGPPD